MRDLILRMFQAVVDQASNVRIELQEGDPATWRVRVHPSDVGLAIGKEGRIVNAIRTIAKGVAKREGQTVRLELVKPTDATSEQIESQ